MRCLTPGAARPLKQIFVLLVLVNVFLAILTQAYSEDSNDSKAVSAVPGICARARSLPVASLSRRCWCRA
jgi:hypothetical protein